MHVVYKPSVHVAPHAYTCKHAMYKHIHTHTCTCTCKHKHALTHAYTHAYTHMDTRLHTCTHMHTHTHTKYKAHTPNTCKYKCTSHMQQKYSYKFGACLLSPGCRLMASLGIHHSCATAEVLQASQGDFHQKSAQKRAKTAVLKASTWNICSMVDNVCMCVYYVCCQKMLTVPNH